MIYDAIINLIRRIKAASAHRVRTGECGIVRVVREVVLLAADRLQHVVPETTSHDRVKLGAEVEAVRRIIGRIDGSIGLK